MWRKWANRIVLAAVAGSVLLAASSGLDQPQALASAGDNTHSGVTLPPNQGPIGVQAAPAVSIAAPSSAIGDFGANSGNVWDMNSTADIVWRQSDASGHQIALSQPEPGIVHGVTPQGSDLAIGFYTSSSTNLPSSQYHHLLYRLKIAAGSPPLSCATNGRVLYTTQWPNWLGHQKYTHAYSPELGPLYCAYGGYCLYYMDLSSNSNGSSNTTWPYSPVPWPTDGVKGFGIWPHEVWYGSGCSQVGPASFDLDYVYLTGDIVARAADNPPYRYQVKYYVSDPDGGTGTAELRYQQLDELQLPSNSPTCNSSNFTTAWTYLAQQTVTFGAAPPSYPSKVHLPIIMGGISGGGIGQYNQTYDWNLTTGYQDGKSYYLCIRVDDGTSPPAYTVSTAPVIRVPVSPYFGPN
jgi:hypothetical protein